MRHRGLPLWSKDDLRRVDLVRRRCKTAEEVASWVKDTHGRYGLNGHDGQKDQNQLSTRSIKSTQSTYPEIAANAALVLINVACSLLDRQLQSQAETFTKEGGFSERLYRIRKQVRQS